MNLPTLILSAIKQKKEITGYDITKMFTEDVLGSTWVASHQQVYRELKKLEQEEFLAFTLVPQDGKPDKKVYFLTEMGESKLTSDAISFDHDYAYRDQLAVGLHACFYSGNLKSYEMTLKDEINYCLDKIEMVKREFGYLAKSKMENLLIKKRIISLQARVDWAQEALEAIA